MKIQKLGHCCFIAEPVAGIRIMTDPGSFSTMQNDVKNISAIVITHEHIDHLHIDSLVKVLQNNPGATVITNSSVGKLLAEAGIEYEVVENKQKTSIKGVPIIGFGNEHAEIYGTYGRVQNTGYMIDTLCYPGDAFTKPRQRPDILALPSAGPWMRIKDAIDYAKDLKPRVAFPVHDATLFPITSFIPKIIGHFLNEVKIEFKVLEPGKEEEV
jgi:L-ascorbate metabolism protein UlaG (beta-lactamase superfamily)